MAYTGGIGGLKPSGPRTSTRSGFDRVRGHVVWALVAFLGGFAGATAATLLLTERIGQ